MTEAAYLALCADDCGVCLSCGNTDTSFVEPDAENYRCDACGLYTVMGAENALISGHIDLTDPSDTHDNAIDAARDAANGLE